MAVIRAFKGLRFDSGVGSLDEVTAPPYDVISEAQRNELAHRNVHNIVHLTLPENRPDDRSKYVKYMRSGAALAEWRRDKVLVPEQKPAIYRYTQTFCIPGSTETLSRTKIIALIKTEPYENGVVLPHEQTFPKHKEDRMRILEATRAHLECIFGLYEDPAGEILSAIRSAPVSTEVIAHSEDGIDHVLEPITDGDAIQQLVSGLVDKKVWIADGHHRYETAVAFREKIGPKDGPIAEDFMMMALCSLSDPGLVLLPTHRTVRGIELSRDELISKVSPYFKIQDSTADELVNQIEAIHRVGTRAFGIACAEGCFVITPNDDRTLIDLIKTDDSQNLKTLDVSILHRVIFEKCLDVQGLDRISYTRDANEAISWATSDAVSFLMNPPSVEDMKIIALGGEKMPQKSTYYFPKILSGLVMWSLNDF